jgi:peptidoglycan/xylan/chitin deacetylase (PgdA/CDA1 family)
MLFSTAVAAAAVFAPLASAHGPPGVPHIMGLDSEGVKRVFAGFGSRHVRSADIHDDHVLDARQNTPASRKECGEGVGSCPQDKCCSQYGYCGTGPKFCYSPNCDYKFGPACPENVIPKGDDTSSIPRPKVGNVLYGGAGVSGCKKPGTVAITYDDGPMKDYTSHILDIFKKYNAHATFFVSGHNIAKGQIDVTDEYIQVIKRMDAEGHQIGSHTWTHLALDDISQKDRHLQMINNEMAIRNIVGKIPTYMRPPYSKCKTADCQKDMADLGYHISDFNFSTEDYLEEPKGTFQNSLDWFKGNITKGNATPEKNDWLTIAHDIIGPTAYNLTEFMLSTLTQLGYKAVTIGDCLNDPPENWYRSADNSSSTSSKSSDPSATGSDGSSKTQDGSPTASTTVQVTQSAASGFASSSLAVLSLSAVVAFAFAF